MDPATISMVMGMLSNGEESDTSGLTDMIGGEIDAISIINMIGGSKLDQQRYLKIWTANGYNIAGEGFQRWLFGKRGNNNQRAGALTADMLGGHPLILEEAQAWKVKAKNGNGSTSDGGATSTNKNPIALGPIAWFVIGAILLKVGKSLMKKW
jgi:hypothetical protein